MEKHDLTLVILAAGMGTRFGGDKQLASLGPNGETMLELSLSSAYKAGFRQSVLVIRPELEAELTTRLNEYLPADFTYQFCYQNLKDLPLETELDVSHRTKPWGTAHALYSARQCVRSSMAVINADDYYGDSAFELLVIGLTADTQNWMMVAYPLALTLSENGGVNRGVCDVKQGQLLEVNEWFDITANGKDDTLTGMKSGMRHRIAADTPVSMTCWGFHHNIFTDLNESLQSFALEYGKDLQKECFLPDVVQGAINKGQKLNVATATNLWLGVTYPEDAALVKAKLLKWADGANT